MLPLDDPRWNSLEGGYRVPFDPRSLLLKLEAGIETQAAYQTLVEELYHQGDVGVASYAIVSHLARLYPIKGIDSWSVCALVAYIELARTKGNNPSLPDWLSVEYFAGIDTLAGKIIGEFTRATDLNDVRAMLSVLALWKGCQTHASFLVEYNGDELLEMAAAAARRS